MSWENRWFPVEIFSPKIPSIDFSKKDLSHWIWSHWNFSCEINNRWQMAMGSLPRYPKIQNEKKRDQPVADPEILQNWIKTENGIRYDQMFCETGERTFEMTSSSAVSGFGSKHFDASSFWIHIPIRNMCYLNLPKYVTWQKKNKQGWAKKTQLFLAQHSPLHHSPNHHIPVAIYPVNVPMVSHNVADIFTLYCWI